MVSTLERYRERGGQTERREILAAMAKQSIAGSRSALQRFFDRHNVSFKKKPARGRAKARRCRSRPPTLDTRARHAGSRALVFIDETATSTNMVRLRGRCLRGERLVASVP